MANRLAARLKKIDFLAGNSLPATFFVALLFATQFCPAQTADQAWMRYSRHAAHIFFPRNVTALGTGALEQSAVAELKLSLGDLVSASLSPRARGAMSGKTVIGTAEEVRKA